MIGVSTPWVVGNIDDGREIGVLTPEEHGSGIHPGVDKCFSRGDLSHPLRPIETLGLVVHS